VAKSGNKGLQARMESHHWPVEGHSPAQFAEVWWLSQIGSFPAIEHCSRAIKLAVRQDSIGVHQHNFGIPGKGLDHGADLVREPYVIKICRENYVAAGKADRILEVSAATPRPVVFDDLDFAGILCRDLIDNFDCGILRSIIAEDDLVGASCLPENTFQLRFHKSRAIVRTHGDRNFECILAH
jgi:hypothetical protein